MAELLIGAPLFPGESGVDQHVEIIKVLGTPTRQQIKSMNPNYTGFKFPQIQKNPWPRVFRPRTPAEAVDVVANILLYEPTDRITPLGVLCHAFFDELRAPGYKLSNGATPPPLFNFTPTELSPCTKEFAEILFPPHTRTDENWPLRSAKSGDGVGESVAGKSSNKK